MSRRRPHRPIVLVLAGRRARLSRDDAARVIGLLAYVDPIGSDVNVRIGRRVRTMPARVALAKRSELRLLASMGGDL